MSGQGFTIGLAVASYEWMAAIALILYGTFFLPYYLKTRITTMPEFLENRFDHKTRLVFAIISVIGYVFIELAVVLYTGSLAMHSIFGLPLIWGMTILCVIAGGYTIYGGLNSIAYTDVVQVTVLILGGLAVTILGLLKVGAATPGHHATIWGGVNALIAGSPEKFHMILPINHPDLPWIGVFFGGMWLANIFYWGCNQFITQRTLAAKDVWHGRMGVVFAGFLKLLVPILVVVPGHHRVPALRRLDRDPARPVRSGQGRPRVSDAGEAIAAGRVDGTGHGWTARGGDVAHRIAAGVEFFDRHARRLPALFP